MDIDQEVKQHFIQVCATYGCLKTTDAIEILRPICQKYEVNLPENTRFKEFIESLSEELNQYDHNISFIKYPITKEEYIVFRTVNSKVIRFLNQYTEQDRNYFRLVLNTLAVMEDYGIPEIQAVNLTSQIKNKPLTKSRAENLLQNWKQIGYFFEADDKLYLGPRMIVEFESYLLNCFPDDVKECSLCKKIVLWDTSCNDCSTKFHVGCIRKYLIKSSNCPSCQKLWTTPFN